MEQNLALAVRDPGAWMPPRSPTPWTSRTRFRPQRRADPVGHGAEGNRLQGRRLVAERHGRDGHTVARSPSKVVVGQALISCPSTLTTKVNQTVSVDVASTLPGRRSPSKGSS